MDASIKIYCNKPLKIYKSKLILSLMKKIFSKVNEELLHIISRLQEGERGKMIFLVPPTECLQVAVGSYLSSDYAFSGAHKHNPQDRITKKTQETFILISGKVQIALYDINDQILTEEILLPGDCYIYLGGGHDFTILEKDTTFYEIKNGPYLDREKDKTFIKA